jgi:hypothetical protein
VTWREQLLAATREVGRVFISAEQHRYCVRVLRVENEIKLIVADAGTVTDDEVRAGVPPAILHEGFVGPVMYVLRRGSNPYRISREEFETIDRLLGDARAEIASRRALQEGKVEP